MLTRHHRALELDKILEKLAALTTIADARDMALELLPETTLYGAQTLINQTNAAYQLLSKYGGPSFGSAKNVNSALFRASAGGMLTMRELLDVGEVLRVIRSLYDWRFRQPGADSCLDVFFSSLMPNRALEDRIFTSIMSDEEMADHASRELADIRRKIRNQSQSIREKLEGMLRSSHYQKYLQDAIITQRNGRFVVPVKNEFRGEVAGLVHDTSGSGATVFIEPMAVVEANNEIRMLEGKEKEEIERILTELSAMAGEVAETVKHNFESVVELNLIFAKAQLAYQMKASLPILNTEGVTELKRARHPLLDPKTVVPIDVRLGGDYDQLIITGPNTGGKTVSIKTLGLLTLMAACGLMIPAADESKVCIFEKVFADIGDEQSIEQSLSTFSSHMKNIVEIMAKADPDSLCLFDELGAGTDPTEGAALAMAILSRLHTDAIRTMATTHYSELKIYALNTEGVENASCEFDVATLRPTYRLLVGIPGKSNAFAIAKKLGLDETIIEEAGSYINSNEEAFEDVIAELDRQRREMEKAEAEIRRLKRDTEQMQKEAEQRRGSMEAQREKLLREAREEARAILQEAKDKADQAIKDLRKSGQSVGREQEDIRSALRLAVQDTDEKLAEADAAARKQRQVTVTEKKLRLGDTVHVHSLGLKGTVLSLPDAKGDLTVQMGILKSKVNASDVELVPEATTTLEGRRHVGNGGGNTFQKALTIRPEINLIGQTTDEAVMNLEKYIDDAYLAHMEKIRIIHGRGTGALKGAVTKALQKNRYIKSFESAPFNEGGYGATVAYLKKG